jgi:hypothetical protein
VTRSVTGCIPTRSVGTINDHQFRGVPADAFPAKAGPTDRAYL